MSETKERDHRLDLIKTVAISLVLLWHLKPFQLTLTSEASLSLKLLKFFVDQFDYQVTLVAVPLFFLVSIYLFFEKMQGRIVDYSRKRLFRILEIYLFWTVIQSLVYISTTVVTSYQAGEIKLKLPPLSPEFFMNGGYGVSVFYFLFALLVITALASVYGLLWKQERFLTLVSIGAIAAGLLYFEYRNITYANIPYWRVENFLIYVPAAYLIWRDKKGWSLYLLPFLILGYAVFSAYDLHLARIGPEPGIYGRASIALGASALFVVFLQFKSLKGSKVILLISTYSLGIFALHSYWQRIFYGLLKKSGLQSQPLFNIESFDFWKFAAALLVIGVTALSILLLKKTALKRYIR